MIFLTANYVMDIFVYNLSSENWMGRYEERRNEKFSGERGPYGSLSIPASKSILYLTFII